jgi:UDP-N-acetyl-2-amino-2-deoxyglucuronate dehydrogenase
MMTTPVGLAIIGLGMAHKPHVEALRNLAGKIAIKHCFAPSQARREAFAALHPDLPIASSLDQVLADPEVEVLLILTPPWTHHDLVLAAAKAGKHVLLEKPLDVNAERARQSVEVMRKAGLNFGVVFQHRFRAASQTLRGLVESGQLGELISGSASIRWWRSPDYYAQEGRGMKARDGGGVLLTQAIHTLDLFMSLTGPIRTVSAMVKTTPLRKIDTEDLVAAAIEFDNGAIGTIDATTVSYPGQPERIELACEHATAILAAEDLTVYFKDGRVMRNEGAAEGGGGADPMAFSCAAHQAVIEDFADALRAGHAPRCSGEEAAKVHGLIEALLESGATHKQVTIKA